MCVLLSDDLGVDVLVLLFLTLCVGWHGVSRSSCVWIFAVYYFQTCTQVCLVAQGVAVATAATAATAAVLLLLLLRKLEETVGTRTKANGTADTAAPLRWF